MYSESVGHSASNPKTVLTIFDLVSRPIRLESASLKRKKNFFFVYHLHALLTCLSLSVVRYGPVQMIEMIQASLLGSHLLHTKMAIMMK